MSSLLVGCAMQSVQPGTHIYTCKTKMGSAVCIYVYLYIICNDNNQRKRIASFQELCFEISKQLVSTLLIHFYLPPKKCPSVLWTSTHYIERVGGQSLSDTSASYLAAQFHSENGVQKPVLCLGLPVVTSQWNYVRHALPLLLIFRDILVQMIHYRGMTCTHVS